MYAIQRLRHYILLRTTVVVVDVNTFQYVLSWIIFGGKFNKWIVILQKFDLDFQSAKSKKSLFFAELIAEFPVEEDIAIEEDSFLDEHILLISTSDPWYRDILVYLQNLKCPTTFSLEEWRKLRTHAKNYLIIGDTLYCRGVDFVLRWCLTHEDDEIFLNDAHSGACGGHLSGLATAQKILSAGYFWPMIFKYCWSHEALSSLSTLRQKNAVTSCSVIFGCLSGPLREVGDLLHDM